MEKTIASMYQITGELGSGGMGVVYDGYHLRLKKRIVLKADKRSLSADSERLRKEVDTLKGLHHTYLPQVYDFVQEDGIVYTVMDYIEGESLDKPLKRGDKFSQRDVVEWACEILEALSYLHNQDPPILHADIKPANIMLTDQNEIRLIDFNIALALKEEGAVQTIYSSGYASPEHYGIDYSRVQPKRRTSDETLTMEDEGETRFPEEHGVPLTKRSDIYSVGATLYYFLTGERPAQDARDVKPISQWTTISPPIARIIEKAMNPNPNLRYQTAEEMLWEFEHLHENDPRTKKHISRSIFAAIVSVLIVLAGAATVFVGQTQLQRMADAKTNAGYSAEFLRQGDVKQAISYALKGLPEKRGILDPPYVPQAQQALANALGVYDLSDGYKAHLSISLPSEPLKTSLSPDGAKVAALLRDDGNWKIQVFNTEDGKKIADLPAAHSVFAEFVFRDNDTLIYAGEDSLTSYDLTNGGFLWQSGLPATKVALSANGMRVASIYQDETRAEVYNAVTGEHLTTVDFDGRRQTVTGSDGYLNVKVRNEWSLDVSINLLALNVSGRWLAVSFSGGGLRLYNLDDPELVLTILDESDYTGFDGGFCESCFAFTATGQKECAFAVFDLGSYELLASAIDDSPYLMQINETGIYLSSKDELVQLEPYTLSQRDVAHTTGNIRSFVHTAKRTIVQADDKICALFSSDARIMREFSSEPDINFLALRGDFILIASRDARELVLWKFQQHSEKTLMFSYDSAVEHSEARVHTDGETAMLFQRDRLLILNQNGPLHSNDTLANEERPYDQRYVRKTDGDVLEISYYDGTVRDYSAKSGEALIPDRHEEPPDGSGNETFYTESYYIEDPHYGTPVVYDRQRMTQLRVLEQNANLRWAEQWRDLLILSLVTADNERSGQILDKNLDVIADLPNLCDVLPDGTLVFDDSFGTLRRSRIYSIDELIAMAKEQMEVSK